MQFSRKMPEHGRFFQDLQSVDLTSAGKDFYNDFGHIIYMALGVYPPGKGQPDQFHLGRDEVARAVVFAKQQSPDFHTADSAGFIKRPYEGLPGVLVYRNMGQKSPGIQVYGVSPCRLHDRNPRLH